MVTSIWKVMQTRIKKGQYSEFSSIKLQTVCMTKMIPRPEACFRTSFFRNFYAAFPVIFQHDSFMWHGKRYTTCLTVLYLNFFLPFFASYYLRRLIPELLYYWSISLGFNCDKAKVKRLYLHSTLQWSTLLTSITLYGWLLHEPFIKIQLLPYCT